MRIKIKFLGFLAQKIGERIEMNIGDDAELGTVVADIFKKYGLGHFEPNSPAAKARATPGFLRVFLNGKDTPFDQKLKEGDEIIILPPLVGGKM